MNRKYFYALLIAFLGLLAFNFYPFFVNEPSKVVEKSPVVVKGKKVDLSNSSITSLPKYVLDNTDIEELDISNNKITGALPSEIQKLSKLKILRASGNFMTGVPAEIGKLTNLEVLDLSNNKLTGLPYELGNLKNLKEFNISKNSYSKQDLDNIIQQLPKDTKIIF